MRRCGRYILTTCLGVVIVGVTPNANHDADAHSKMSVVAMAPEASFHSDLAFWGRHAFVGYYRGDAPEPGSGIRIFDISDPANPTLVKDIECDGPQADPVVWDRNGNGVADLLLIAVDRPMANPNCGAARVPYETPTGWEGVRIFELSDDPADPFATVTPVAMVYTDCGAQSITLWPGEASEGRLIVYVSSYPLRPGPTCGENRFANTANPYDMDPGIPGNPLHGVVQIIEVPLDNPGLAREIAPRPISYPGDPDGRIEWCERGVCAGIEPAARGCSSITVHVGSRLAVGACGEQAQIWSIDESGVPDTENPRLVLDDVISSGGTGRIPGAVDFFDSATFSNDGRIVNVVDESLGAGCPAVTSWEPRPWNPAGGTHKTGRMFFLDSATGAMLSEFNVGDVRPDSSATAYCSAGTGAAIRSIARRVLVAPWYDGGVNLLDFTNPHQLKEIAHYDLASSGGDRSAYAYAGPSFHSAGHPVYASDGATSRINAKGLVVFRAILEEIRRFRIDHLNPQTVD
jgi:hypothetical protein